MMSFLALDENLNSTHQKIKRMRIKVTIPGLDLKSKPG